ncbi:hypothetical protein LD001_28075 [Pseudomonas kurunegalensis]|mgnify:CR=1 FL=1|uniref:hypothetical protein n=1 Tax=Pseudomonas kurunegalensis TaxID=485880 RepID=UPI001CDCC34C|nr:hypothetical protein [Pseudomonas kurunegalensis]MCA4079092.1 hypothetical protein [Pseudomonas kurunegalensis]
MGDDKAAAIADTLELLHLNQIALRAAAEEVSTWIRQRGSMNVHHNVMAAVETLDTNADAITSGIEQLRQ